MKQVIIIICIIIILLLIIKHYKSSLNWETKIVCYIHDYIYLKEYIDSIFPNNEVIIYNKSDAYFTGNYNYISIRRIPYINSSPNPPIYIKDEKKPNNIVFNSLPYFSNECKVGFLNTEHNTDHVNLNYNKMYINNSIDYYDYSLSNINIFGRGTYLPYKNNPNEINKLINFINKPKKFDVCLVGTKSERRNIIVEQIKCNNITIDYIQGFGGERDERIGRCKILLNIHMYDNWKVYEEIRCERWRFAGMTIISEKCIDILPEGIIECTLDNVIEKIKTTLYNII